MFDPYEQIDQMLKEAQEARSAIRHALQFLRDATHQGDGHLTDCIRACEQALKTDGKWERPQRQPLRSTGPRFTEQSYADERFSDAEENPDDVQF